MGMLDDILKSIQGAPGGGTPIPGGAGSQAMSPMAKLLLGLLAIYAVKHVRRDGQPGAQPAPGGSTAGGGLGDLLKGPLGGILAGAGAGQVLGGGLDGLLKQLKDGGQSRVADSWVSRDPNEGISEGDLAKALGSDTLDTLAGQTGMRREDVLSGLQQHLPQFVDRLTPQGRLPTEKEWDRML
jgi:uncharacterized protein YidB (DUF937 family)